MRRRGKPLRVNAREKRAVVLAGFFGVLILLGAYIFAVCGADVTSYVHVQTGFDAAPDENALSNHRVASSADAPTLLPSSFVASHSSSSDESPESLVNVPFLNHLSGADTGVRDHVALQGDGIQIARKDQPNSSSVDKNDDLIRERRPRVIYRHVSKREPIYGDSDRLQESVACRCEYPGEGLYDVTGGGNNWGTSLGNNERPVIYNHYYQGKSSKSSRGRPYQYYYESSKGKGRGRPSYYTGNMGKSKGAQSSKRRVLGSKSKGSKGMASYEY